MAEKKITRAPNLPGTVGYIARHRLCPTSRLDVVPLQLDCILQESNKMCGIAAKYAHI